MNKFILKILIPLASLLLIAGTTQAQLAIRVNQGGTGWNAINSNLILFGDTSLRLGTSSALEFATSTNRLTVTAASTTILSATSFAYFGGTATSTFNSAGLLITQGLISQASSTFSSGAFRVEGAATFPGGVTITCTSCITDANVADTITLTNITQITNRAISDTTGTLTVARGGTGLTTFAAGNLVYASALDTLAGLTVGASSTVLTSDGSLPLWTASPALTSLIVSTNLGIPRSSTLATSAGQMGIDTTSGQLRFNDGQTTQVIVATSSFGFNVASSTWGAFGGLGSTATSTLIKRGLFGAITITEISCRSKSTTTVPNAILQIGDGSASATPIAFCNNAGQVVPLSSGNTFTANEDIYIGIGTATGTVPDKIFPDIRYKFDSN